MNINQKIWSIAITAIGWIPSVSFAEVSDKIPSIQALLISGLFMGGGLFFMARFRWWLGVLMFPIPILLIADNVSVYWNETAMREALINEQGWIYFCALGIQGALIITGAITGVIFGYKAVKGRKSSKF